MNFSKDEYRLDFFVDEGFQRKKCEKCGKFFWSRDEISKLDYSDWRTKMSQISDIISSEEKNMTGLLNQVLGIFPDCIQNIQISYHIQK